VDDLIDDIRGKQKTSGIKPYLNRLKNAGFGISEDLYRLALEKTGETE